MRECMCTCVCVVDWHRTESTAMWTCQHSGHFKFILSKRTHAPSYHWRELPQVSFLSRQKTNTCLLRQKYFCRDKRIFVLRNIILSRQAYFCRDKRVCCDETRLLSRQKYACRDRTFVATKTCFSRQTFLSTNVLSRQKYFIATNINLIIQTPVIPHTI